VRWERALSDGEIHRADEKTPAGMMIEIRHQAMADEERLSGEGLYQGMVGIIGSRRIGRDFDIHHRSPDSGLSRAEEIAWAEPSWLMHVTLATSRRDLSGEANEQASVDYDNDQTNKPIITQSAMLIGRPTTNPKIGPCRPVDTVRCVTCPLELAW
jgi:hypothetical protein